MKLKLLILMVLALTVTACEEPQVYSTDYVDKLEARVSVLEKVFINICNHSARNVRGQQVNPTIWKNRDGTATWSTFSTHGGSERDKSGYHRSTGLHEHKITEFDEGFCEDVTGETVKQ